MSDLQIILALAVVIVAYLGFMLWLVMRFNRKQDEDLARLRNKR